MRGGRGKHVVGLAAGGGASLKARPVPAGYASPSLDWLWVLSPNEQPRGPGDRGQTARIRSGQPKAMKAVRASLRTTEALERPNHGQLSILSPRPFSSTIPPRNVPVKSLILCILLVHTASFQLLYNLLAGPGIGKIGRAHLDRRGADHEILENVLGLLDSAQTQSRGF